RTRPMSRRCHHGSPRHARTGRVPSRPVAPDRAARPERGPLIDRPIAAERAPRPPMPAAAAHAGLVVPDPSPGPIGEAGPAGRDVAAAPAVDPAQGAALDPATAPAAPAPTPAVMPGPPPRGRRSDGPRAGATSPSGAQATLDGDDATV